MKKSSIYKRFKHIQDVFYKNIELLVLKDREKQIQKFVYKNVS